MRQLILTSIVMAAWAAVPGRGDTPVDAPRPLSPASVTAYERAAARESEQSAVVQRLDAARARSDDALAAAGRNSAEIGEVARKADWRIESVRNLAARATDVVTSHTEALVAIERLRRAWDDSRMAAGAYSRASSDERRTLAAHADLTAFTLTKARDTTAENV